MRAPQSLINMMTPNSFLPPGSGPFEVGYVDIMTEGRPEDSSFIRLYYPTQQNHRFLPERCPIWTEHDTKHGFINFLQVKTTVYIFCINGLVLYVFVCLVSTLEIRFKDA